MHKNLWRCTAGAVGQFAGQTIDTGQCTIPVTIPGEGLTLTAVSVGDTTPSGAGGYCNSGRRTCGNHVRRTNGVEMVETPWLNPGTFDPGTCGHDACVPWHVPQLRPEGAPPGGAVASARLVAGPIVEGLPDGQAALGAVEVVGLRPGRQEWSYCLRGTAAATGTQ